MPRFNAKKAPTYLGQKARENYHRTVALMESEGYWNDAYAAVLERYARALERAEDGRKLAAHEGMTTRGSQGQLVEHPGVKSEREADRDAHRYAQALLLTPESRKAELARKPKDSGALSDIVGGSPLRAVR